ncbi:tetratricopeptide repeat protein [Pyxidicoccus xibeiensis]|uniref:tetratricopeptide repeat protein n=1 Tax=Pyxidicoccus xibeiensis TaxID=2906759 RepID=UPI0020A81FC7|nr:tetratricopeptide repeat protein [Pyxidicoccus xibeiensis]MCP3141404.1 tetratricopeptide repeat protein [Pyxidicoccus xibeiensis]
MSSKPQSPSKQAPEPKQPESNAELPQDVAERLLRGELELGQFLGLSRDKLYEYATTGHQMLQAGRTQQALKIFQGLVAASPKDSVFHAQLGATLLTLERVDEAFEAYDTALRFNNGNVDAYVGRGEIHLRRGSVPEGLKDLSRAIELDPGLARRSTQRAHGTLLALKRQAEQVKTKGRPAPGAKK